MIAPDQPGKTELPADYAETVAAERSDRDRAQDDEFWKRFWRAAVEEDLSHE